MCLRIIGDELEPPQPSISCSRASRSASRSGAAAARVLIAVDRLAQQRDLQAAVVGQRRASATIFAAAGSAPARGPGHDAIGAELVAAEHDPHHGLVRRGPHLRDRAADRSFRSSRSISCRVAGLCGRGSLPAAARRRRRSRSSSSGSWCSWPGPTTRSTCGARSKISFWSFWAMQPRTPMILCGFCFLACFSRPRAL